MIEGKKKKKMYMRGKKLLYYFGKKNIYIYIDGREEGKLIFMTFVIILKNENENEIKKE